MPLNPPTRSAPGFQSVTPVLLSSACNVLAGSEATANSENLSYPFRKAVIIEEIRWDLKVVTNTGALNPNLGAIVATKLQLGQLYLMRDPVPIWSLATLISVEQEQFTETLTAYSHYRWRLPKPLYVEAGQVLRSVFSRGYVNDGYDTINVQVSYLGKTVAPNQPRPGVIAVPYAAPFVTTAGAVYAQSNEYHLFNPFDFDLHIQRLTGRLLDITSGPPPVLAQLLGSTTPNTAQSAPTIQMTDSWGGKMVNDFTGIGDVFDLSRAAWTVDTVLPPKGVYTVQVWNLNTGRPAQAFFAMIGTRDERLS